MLTKAQAHEIIKAATDGDATRALLILVYFLTDPNSPEFDERPRVSESWTLERVKALTPSGVKTELRLHGLATGPNTDLDWNMAMGAAKLAVELVGSVAFTRAWEGLFLGTPLLKLTPEHIARVALWAVVMPK